MNNHERIVELIYERIVELIDELQANSQEMNGCLDIARAGHMLLVSESLASALLAFLYKTTNTKG